MHLRCRVYTRGMKVLCSWIVRFYLVISQQCNVQYVLKRLTSCVFSIRHDLRPLSNTRCNDQTDVDFRIQAYTFVSCVGTSTCVRNLRQCCEHIHWQCLSLYLCSESPSLTCCKTLWQRLYQKSTYKILVSQTSNLMKELRTVAMWLHVWK